MENIHDNNLKTYFKAHTIASSKVSFIVTKMKNDYLGKSCEKLHLMELEYIGKSCKKGRFKLSEMVVFGRKRSPLEFLLDFPSFDTNRLKLGLKGQ